MATVCLFLACAIVVMPQSATGSTPASQVSGQFKVKLDAGAIVSLQRSQDSFNTEYVQSGRRLGDIFLRFRGKDAAWQSVDTSQLAREGRLTFESSADGRLFKANYEILYAPAGSNTGPSATQSTPLPVLSVEIEFRIEERDILWSFTIKNVGVQPRQIDDLAIPLPITTSTPGGDNQRRINVLKHSFVSGYNSYMYWMRSNNVGPYLMLTPREDTKLEYLGCSAVDKS